MAKQKHVRILQSVSGHNTDKKGSILAGFSYGSGEVVSLDTATANKWCKAGVAEPATAGQATAADVAALKKELAAARKTIAAQSETIQDLHAQIAAAEAEPDPDPDPEGDLPTEADAADDGDGQPELEV